MNWKKLIPSRRVKIILLTLFGVFLGLLGWTYFEGTHVVEATHSVDELGTSVVGQVTPLFGGTGVEIWGVVDAPADHVWRVVTDQDRFAEFMPYVESSRIVERKPDYLVEDQTLSLPLKRFENLKLKIWYETAGIRRTANWIQIQGAPSVNRGAWVVEAAGPNKTILRYQVLCDPGQFVPQWLLRFFMKHKLKEIVYAVRSRVASLPADYFKVLP